MKSAPRCRKQHVLDEHAQIKPASSLEAAVDCDDQANGSTEEDIVLRRLTRARLCITGMDAKRTIKDPPELLPSLAIRRRQDIRIVLIFGNVLRPLVKMGIKKRRRQPFLWASS